MRHAAQAATARPRAWPVMPPSNRRRPRAHALTRSWNRPTRGTRRSSPSPRRAPASCRCRCGECLLRFFRRPDAAMMERRFDQPRAQCVHAHAAFEPFDRRGLRHPDHRVLARDIHRRILEADQPAHRCVVDDAARTLPQHDLSGVLHRVEHAAHVRFEHPVEPLGILLEQRREHAFRAGVVERDVEASVGRYREIEQLAQIVFVRDIRDGGLRFAAGSHDFVDQSIGGLAPRGDDDLGAAPREFDRGRAANAGAGARDHCDAAVELGRFRVCVHDEILQSDG